MMIRTSDPFLTDMASLDESVLMDALLASFPWDDARGERVGAATANLVTRIRSQSGGPGLLESFLMRYGLDSAEGLSLLTLAEALLRIPDSGTAAALVRDRLAGASWADQGQSSAVDSWIMRLSGMGLRLSRSVVAGPLGGLGEPVVRQVMGRVVRLLGRQFVLGSTIGEAVRAGRSFESKGYRLSYDMLGEGARSAGDAERYFRAYEEAVRFLAKARPGAAGISVKLSALYPRYTYGQADRCLPVLQERLLHLARLAAEGGLSLTVDAEESERLELSLRVMEPVFRDAGLSGWDGFGLAVQAYGRRAHALVGHLQELAEESGRRIQVRLVKGAYWDSEIKRAQLSGVSGFPVFTRKANTDTSYLACAYRLLVHRDRLSPLFATHNAHTVSAIRDLAGVRSDGYGFQRLHGMGEALHDALLADGDVSCGIYAPVGSYADLLPYLVRRMLENGANASFVSRLRDPAVPVAALAADPVRDARDHETRRHPHVRLPGDLYAPERPNSSGVDLLAPETAEPFARSVVAAVPDGTDVAAPLINGRDRPGVSPVPIVNPADWGQIVGLSFSARPEDIAEAFSVAERGFAIWTRTPATRRAEVLERAADLLEQRRESLVALLVREAGKTIPDALSEVREAVDFCRYYAVRGREDFSEAGRVLPGPVGESNRLWLEGRGVFVCISPWNFPLAIFLGQIAAALMAGNAVIAKPAEQTPLVAMRAVRILLEAGVASEALALLPGDGAVGAEIVRHPRVAGVAFTGSNAAAWSINRALADKMGPIVPFIAETGGQNVMVVDSSALPEQVVDDVMVSAFNSAGQRCSALRVLYVQDQIADRVLTMLSGAMQEMVIGDPLRLSTDVGPVIDGEALERLTAHRTRLQGIGRKIADAPLDPIRAAKGHFFAPCAYEIPGIEVLEGEVFGPILHVVRFGAGKIDSVLEAARGTGFGLTFGLHSRIESLQRLVAGVAPAGNVYVNRSVIGAVVGVQPFGGLGLSGTGPKAGGPYYLHRFAQERAVSVNTAAAGGNATLVCLNENN